MRPILSVCVSAFNRAKLLELCLKSLLLTEAPRSEWEIVVIDDGSTDETPGFLAEWWVEQAKIKPAAAGEPHSCHYFRRRLNVGHGNNVGLARNCGLQKSKGEYVAFVDGDCIFCSDAISRTIAWAKTDKKSFLTSGHWYRVVRTTQWMLDGLRGLQSSVPFGPWFAIRREALVEIGGFDERFVTYGAEDEDIVTRLVRLKYQPMRDSEIIAVHLWHMMGSNRINEEQRQRQIEWTRNDPSVVRNENVEWGALS